MNRKLFSKILNCYTNFIPVFTSIGRGKCAGLVEKDRGSSFFCKHTLMIEHTFVNKRSYTLSSGHDKQNLYIGKNPFSLLIALLPRSEIRIKLKLKLKKIKNNIKYTNK